MESVNNLINEVVAHHLELLGTRRRDQAKRAHLVRMCLGELQRGHPAQPLANPMVFLEAVIFDQLGHHLGVRLHGVARDGARGSVEAG